MNASRIHVTPANGGDDYTTEPTHLRIYFDGAFWNVDAADDDGNYTELVYTFDTSAEAFASVPTFLDWCARDSVTFQWRSVRTVA